MEVVVVPQASSGEQDRSGYRLVSLEIPHRISPSISHCRTFERIVISAYRWLAENYIPGDRIFLFGKRVLVIVNIISINYIPIRVFSRCLSGPRSSRHD